MKKVKLYMIEDISQPSEDNTPNFVCVLARKKDFKEFVISSVYEKHKDHFVNWCDCHNQNKDDPKVLINYIGELMPEEVGNYIMHTVRLGLDDVASIFRLFHHYRPMGASYETPAEAILKIALEKGEVK